MKYFLDTEFLEGPQNQYFFGYKTPIVGPNTIDLISIGIVAEDGREYYAISKDFNLKEAWNRYDENVEVVSGDMRNKFPNGRKYKVYWIRENVLKLIFEELLEKYDAEYKKALQLGICIGTIMNYDFSYKLLKFLINRYGKNNKEIAEEIKSFTTVAVTKVFENGTYIVGATDDMKPIRANFVWSKPEFYADYANYDWVVFCWLFGKMIDLPNGFPMYCNDIQQLSQYKCDLINKEARIDISGATKVTKKSFKENNPNYPIQDNSKKHHALEDARHDRDLYNFLNKL